MEVRKGIAALAMGTALVANLGLAGIVRAEGKPLSAYGVPDVSGLKPKGVTRLDKSDSIPGKETTYSWYQRNGLNIFTYEINGKLYAVGLDTDGKFPPVEKGYIDPSGDGNFTEIKDNKGFYAPDWVGKQ